MKRKTLSRLVALATALTTSVLPLSAFAGPSDNSEGQRMGSKSHFVAVTAEVSTNNHLIGTVHGYSHELTGFIATGYVELRDANNNLVGVVVLPTVGINGEYPFSSGSDRTRNYDTELPADVARQVTRVVARPTEGYINPLDLIGENKPKFVANLRQ